MRLTMEVRNGLSKEICQRYRKSSKKKKGKILDEFVETTGYDRCYARWLLRHHGFKVQVAPTVVLEGDARRVARRRPVVQYGPEVVAALKELWTILDFISSKRLVAALPELIPRLVACRELRLTQTVRRKLLRISASTVDRLLQTERARYQLRGRSGTKPGSLLKHQVAVRTFAEWDQAQPGFLEIDLVGHDGGSTAGDYCQTLDMTDVATGWTVQWAVLNKAEKWVFEALQSLRGGLPFPLKGLDSDNGSEFINNHLVRYCQEQKITLTRARPHRKNDTCYVEQKNWSIVRRFVGYGRYEGERACQLLNELYVLLHDYVNYFLPSMKLTEKIQEGPRTIRRYDTPKTPYQRVMDSPHVSTVTKKKLMAYYETLNPAELHRNIQRLQRKLSKLAVRVTNPGEVPR